MNSIFTITSIALNPEAADSSTMRTRSFGWFSTKERAVAAVEKNQCDLHECYYEYIVVEEVPEGIHAIGDNRWWFCWDTEEDKWKSCEAPHECVNIVAWSLG